MPTTTEVKALFTQGVMNRVTYIRLLLDSMRPAGTPHAPHQISVQELAANYAIAPTELFTQLANMSRDGIIAGTLPNFTATWTDPNILTTYTPDQVIRLRAENMFRQKGYLFFCLGADNPSKTTSQLVNTARITDYYKLSMPDFFGELARLTGDRTLITDLDRITIQWLEYVVPVVAPTDNVSAALAKLNEAIAEANSRINSLEKETPTGGVVDLTPIEQRITALEKVSSPIKAWGKIALVEPFPDGRTFIGAGVERFEPSPETDAPGNFRIYLSQSISQYTVLLSCSDGEGMFTLANVREPRPNYFDIMIYAIGAGEMPTEVVSFAVLA